MPERQSTRVREYENYPNLVGLPSKAEREVLMPDRQSTRVREPVLRIHDILEPIRLFFLIDLQDANKKTIKKKVFCILLFEGTGTFFIIFQK